MTDPRINFAHIQQRALPHLLAILRRVLPGGKVVGREYIALNPRRHDNRPGSFKVNLLTGRWADFAVSASGGDVVSLVAYLFALSQSEAAQRVICMIGGAP